MAAHDELNDVAKAIRDRMSALRAQDEGASLLLDEAGRRGSLRRSQSLSAAECHLANFHRIVTVHSLSSGTCWWLLCLRYLARSVGKV